MTEQLLTTIITVIGTIVVALSGGVITYAVAQRQDRTQRANRADELEQAKTAAVQDAQQQVVETAVSILTPLKEQNDWLTRQVHELQARLSDVEAKLKIELGEKAKLLRENADLRAAYNTMSRKVQKLERFIRANIGRDIDTDDLDSSPELGTFADTRRSPDDTPPLPNKSPFADPPPPDSDDPADWQ